MHASEHDLRGCWKRRIRSLFSQGASLVLEHGMQPIGALMRVASHSAAPLHLSTATHLRKVQGDLWWAVCCRAEAKGNCGVRLMVGREHGVDGRDAQVPSVDQHQPVAWIVVGLHC